MGPPLQIMQVNIQKIIFLLLFGLLSTGLFSHNSYAGDCVNDNDCQDYVGTTNACIFGECMYAYKSYLDTACSNSADCAFLRNPCSDFVCNNQGQCTPQPLPGGGVTEGFPCKQTTCGMAYCDGSRKFCGLGFNSAYNLQYLTAAVASKPLNANPFICKNLPDKCSKEVCTVKGAAPDDSDTDADIEVYNSLCQPELIEGAACTDQNSCTNPDTCQSGVCAGTDVSAQCNDGNICTDDSCDTASGCENVNNSITCNDGKYCTVNDKCSGGSCGGAAKSCADAVSCTADSCNENLDKCVNTPNQVACNDTVSCTIDSCDAISGCKNQPDNTLCNDSVACTDDQCDTAIDCKNTPNNANCNDDVACTIDTCSATDDCSHTPDNSSCDDGDPCTIDSCDATTGCTNKAITCPAKTNACVNGDYETYQAGVCEADASAAKGYVCDYSPNVEDCDDKIACTTDGCNIVAGSVTGCTHSPHNALCPDDNPCTDEKCVKGVGCQYPNDNTNACDDSNKCTIPDVCTDGACTSSPKNCDDSVACTTDSCDATTGACVTTPDNSQCNDTDGLACTEPVCDTAKGCNELLKDGFCVIDNTCYANGDKNPANPCQACISSNEPSDWSFIADGTSCDDGNACTAPDVCTAGQCQSGAALDCNDGNDCTNDECSPSAGCSHPFNTNACSDGDACTSPDVCTSGACAAGTTKDCNDSNPCTVDECDPADGNCDYQIMAGAMCTGPTDSWCNVGTEAEPICQYLQPSCHVVLCEDLIISASSDPMPPYFVLYANDPDYFSTLTDAQLADLKSNLCTGQGIVDVNLAATYVPTINCSMNGGFNYTNVPNQGNLKEETLPAGDPLQYFMSFTLPEGVKGQQGGNMVQCTVELKDIGKTTQACSAPFTVNACADAEDCDDGDLCTNDICNAGVCEKSDITCTEPPTNECNGLVHITWDSSGVCNSATGQCVYTDTQENCGEEANPCTDDSCDVTQGCIHTPNTANICGGTDKCSDYSCNASGQCESSPKACPDDGNACTTEQCNDATGNCESVPSGVEGCCVDDESCEDGNPCTDNACDEATGQCSKVNVGNDPAIECNDGSACTIGDKCVDGICKAGSDTQNCNDSKVCTTDFCDPSTGCTNINVDNGTACGDGNACNGDEICEDGTCAPGIVVACDDDNRCTQDLCTIDGSCSHSLVDECSGPPEWCYVDGDIPPDIECTYKEPVCQVIVCGDGTVKSTAIGEALPIYFVLYSNDPKDFDAAKLAQLKDNLCTKKLAQDVPLAGAFGPQISCTIKQVAKDTDANIPPIADGDLKKIPSAAENIPYPRFISKPLSEEVTKILGPGSIECIVSLDFDPTTTKITEACVAPFEVKDCAEDIDCDDKNPCTNNICTAGACEYPDYICADKDPTCLESDGTVFHITYAPSVCLLTSDPAPQECTYTKTEIDCDDKNPCTTDACDPLGGCTHVNNMEACDDGNSCTVDDVCDAGKCAPGVQKDCNDNSACTDDACDQFTGNCANTPNGQPNCCKADLDCDDKNVCTEDSCNMVTGACSHGAVPLDTPCSDNNACTVGEFCESGVCSGGVGINCDDDNDCTDGSCDPVNGCVHTNNTATCDDSNACTKDDVCKDGACQAGGLLACDDKDDCTDDACDATTGACVYSPNKVCACKVDTDCGDKDPCTQNSCDPATHQCVVASVPGCCIDDDDCKIEDGIGPCNYRVCESNACVTKEKPIEECCYDDSQCDDGDECTDEICDLKTSLCSSTPNDECNACPDGSKPKTCYLVDHHLTAKPGDPCLTCEDDAGNVILSWKNGGNICPPVLDVSQAPNGDVVVTFVPDHIFKFNTGVGDMKKFFFEPPLGLLQDIDLFAITAADGTTSNHAYVTTAAGGIYKGDLTSGLITSLATTKAQGVELQALAPYFLATNADGKQIFLGHPTGIKQLILNENYEFVSLDSKFNKKNSDGGNPFGFELYNGVLFYTMLSYSKIFDSTDFTHFVDYIGVYYSIKLSHNKMFVVEMATVDVPELNYKYGHFSFAPINAAVPPQPWADVIKAALSIGEDSHIPVLPVPSIPIMKSAVALGQLTDVCGGTWDLAIPLDEICDGIDNDLDGLVDEDSHGNPMSEPMEEVLPGLCEKNQMICEKGKWLPDPGNYQPVDEICNNGFDDDCDGMVDEGCEGCTIGDTNPCGIKIGECEPGHTECIANEAGVGVWTGVCEGGTGPVDEICGDNLDNDCDERIDENCCESKCCTTCCCCGTTYAPLPASPLDPLPPEKKVEDNNDPEVAVEAKEEPKPEIIAEDVTEDECIAKGGSFEVVKAADGKPTFKLNKDGTMELFGICWEATGSGCSLNPSAIPAGFNLLWLFGVVPIFIIRLKTR